ncbi:4-diphosphocytidyl-2-C-methyl-D-erythritol kinase [Halobacillus karajensis]|uniref:4-diphosphocytidyl-2-C-methyl-D-erythritol kinase n=1 Tax=Halobacillus karajensis TaxID=195088 RepID=A0A024P9L6_9BACI|nr:4-(cytidine 5'-diphospho)-2-C-methyl-D-erythritol kinase [Halobacillus karajensis]CDQ21773.1 4-diphosphocytidyl-2-C-methyl-D-erythritol kinase [Halobacillus karajensis]CDQ25769.1 4-diphosphocytidyl-2-C-methyl-D-erythritol kinase [Halobacillus karajensis]CDQ29770.1 4-diphosphocytidyl-2-C-methyl-D-erythritol kinase [Halobacillus karajensis]SEI12517.1 4-diphosphocytidyl-2-C-methyl-D-erythritol kinase [Halobacillus karajensis]
MQILEKAPAKINLSLDVLHKRPDGFHEVEMVMTTVDLADRIELSLLSENEIRVESESRFVPNDERNLAYRAAQLIKNRYDVRKGVKIYIEKNIPVAAGLAGGSSDAAAVLRGVNRLWNLGLSLDELAVLGAEIGSDVSFCVYGGTALATGRGEKIQSIPAPPPCWVVLSKPTLGVSTQSVYQNLDVEKAEHPNTKAMVAALKNGDYREICTHVGNTLEGVTLEMHEEVGQIKELMSQAGADAVLMSGSGPTVFSLVEHDARAQRIYNSLKGFCTEVYMVRLLGYREPLDK